MTTSSVDFSQVSGHVPRKPTDLSRGAWQVGNELTLRVPRPAANFDDSVLASIAAAEEKFGATLSIETRKLIATASNGVAQPGVMTLGGVFLGKPGLPVDQRALQALYAEQLWNDQLTAGAGNAVDISALLKDLRNGNAGASSALAAAMAEAIDGPANATPDPIQESAPIAGASVAAFNADGGGSSSQQDDPDREAMRALARQLLATQDQGCFGYHLGNLPVIVGDQLVELDMVMFREPEAASRAQGMKRLVMTLRTPVLGRMEIIAESRESRLAVWIRTENEQSADALSVHGHEVRDLVARLGWNVDSVSYQLNSEPARAETSIVQMDEKLVEVSRD